MHDKFLRVKDIYEPPEGQPTAILVDLDGTLAHMNGRSPYEWSRVGEDTNDKHVADLIAMISSEYMAVAPPRIIIMSGRDKVCAPETMKWLEDNRVLYDTLIMRPEGDNRKDSIVKRELFEEHIRDNYQVLFVLDDRDQVVQMWRDLGLKCLQVAEGNF